MSTVQLMSSSELYDFSRETWRLHHVDWTEPKAQAVLTAWQSRFALEVSQLTMDEDKSQQFNFYSFTPAGLDNVVESASQFSWSWAIARVIGEFKILIIYDACKYQYTYSFNIPRGYIYFDISGSTVWRDCKQRLSKHSCFLESSNGAFAIRINCHLARNCGWWGSCRFLENSFQRCIW